MNDVVFIGDVHGCASELAALIALAAPARVVLVGDLFTKGPDPVGVWSLIKEHACQAVLGNHDTRLLDALCGLRPGDQAAHAVIEQLDRSDDAWRTWLDACPYVREEAGWTVVHAGLHPSGALERTNVRMATTMRSFPTGEPAAPRWHEQYVGERRVVFGHDARGGLVRRERDGEPWVIGLDTGCVYGGVLSGWMPSTDRLIQVPAARAYAPITDPQRRA